MGVPLVSDRREWHYIHVLGPELGRYPNLPPEDIEQGIENFAATLPAQQRIHHLLNAKRCTAIPVATCVTELSN